MYLTQLCLALTDAYGVTVQLYVGKNTREERKIQKITFIYPRQWLLRQSLVGLSKQLKQIIQIAHNIVKNPSNWLEVNLLAIYKRGRGFELGIAEKQIQVVVRAGLEPGTAGLRVRRADHSASPCINSLSSFVHGRSFRHSLHVHCKLYFFEADQPNIAECFQLIRWNNCHLNPSVVHKFKEQRKKTQKTKMHYGLWMASMHGNSGA